MEWFKTGVRSCPIDTGEGDVGGGVAGAGGGVGRDLFLSLA